MIRFRLLGPLRVWDGADWAPVPAGQRRLLLAVLLIRVGRAVDTDQLIGEIWGAYPPRAAASVLRGYVMRLRRQLCGGVDCPLLTRQGGYELAVAEDEVDALVFDRLVAAGRRALTCGRTDEALAKLSQALALWRGPALADVPASPVVHRHADQLAQSKVSASEDWAAAHLELGHGDLVIDELNQLVAEHPLRERLWEHMMLALYRSGRRAEALDAYQRARRSLVAELGLEPGLKLQKLQRAILADDELVRLPSPSARVVPAQLPADVAGFVGREDVLAQLSDVLPEAGRTALVTIAGTAGVGKTTLAVRWAHQVASRFPDGQLHINLRGFDPTCSALTTLEALGSLLDSLQVPLDQVPVGLQPRAALYRSLLAGRRVLVLLDNARDAEQVRPLLPGSPGCLVIVTSREDLSGLVIADGAQPFALNPMSSRDARELLSYRIGADRVVAEPVAVDEIVGRCDGLPLALAIVAARAAHRPTFALAALAAELRDQHGRLDALAGSDPATDMRKVLSWSYRALSEAAKRLFRLLAQHPGPDIAIRAAASLAGETPARTRTLLVELRRAHLVVEQVADRYSLHDLLRAYAAELAQTIDTDADQRAAWHRLLDYHLHSAYLAGLLTEPHRGTLTLDQPHPGTVLEEFDDHQQAHRWLRLERQTLVAVVLLAAAERFDAHTWRMAWVLDNHLARHGQWHDQITVQTAALAAARRLGDRLAEAHADRGLGNAHAWLGRYDDAANHYHDALDTFAALGDSTGEARTHSQVGWLLGRQGRHRDALHHKRQALQLYRAAGHRAGEARALNQVGWTHIILGAYELAIANCKEAVDLLELIGDRHGQGMAWDSLGFAYHHLGRYLDAVRGYQRALALHAEVGDRYNEAETLVHLGDTFDATGDKRAAQAAWHRALDILNQLRHSDAEQVRARLALPRNGGQDMAGRRARAGLSLGPPGSRR